MTSPETTSSYAQAYTELSACARRLRDLPPEDIDSLVGLVEKATAAHRACKQRLEQVKALVAAQLESTDQA